MDFFVGGSEESPTVIVTYKTVEQAETAAEGLNKREFNGRPLKVSRKFIFLRFFSLKIRFISISGFFSKLAKTFFPIIVYINSEIFTEAYFLFF